MIESRQQPPGENTSVFSVKYVSISLFYLIMCLFNFPNKTSVKAREKGIIEFECGSCPECLQKKSRLWALRCSMESKVSFGVMVTLTYDTYKVIYGKESTIEENPTDPTIALSKRDCQLFIKRLRKHFAPQKIKYLLTAERGKRTGRAHYHALLFGVQFDDLIKYKRSDRGNCIYKSKTLEKIWQNGICTVDCINLSAKTARYCTKYCSKDAGVDDTFMLFSRGIGDQKLMEEFNGRSYWIDGREYSIPKQIWQKYICEKYNLYDELFDKKTNTIKKLYYSRYSPLYKLEEMEKQFLNQVNLRGRDTSTFQRLFSRLENRYTKYERGKRRNLLYQTIRDEDKLYQRYLAYWSNKARQYEYNRPTAIERVLALPVDKYRAYKQKAILCKQNQENKKYFIPPRSNCYAFSNKRHEKYKEKTFAPLSRHYRANDTFQKEYSEEIAYINYLRQKILQNVDTNNYLMPKSLRIQAFS